jgi:hypothetical protein
MTAASFEETIGAMLLCVTRACGAVKQGLTLLDHLSKISGVSIMDERYEATALADKLESALHADDLENLVDVHHDACVRLGTLFDRATRKMEGKIPEKFRELLSPTFNWLREFVVALAKAATMLDSPSDN